MGPLATIPSDHGRRARSQPAAQTRRVVLRRGLGVAQPRETGAPRIGTDPLLTADEVAALLQVTKAWVYAETRARRIPHVPLGRYVRYRRSAVLAWIAALERQASRGVRVPIGEE
ncbi:MAG TPA: helix-turn-helix domain-containing protein [Solirubrobacteraceae bacterium]|jgi:excisionase family DNA binding protein|nr:helix-turn-helix domain-containing protein [Solirubrobacteraceae bacterium]